MSQIHRSAIANNSKEWQVGAVSNPFREDLVSRNRPEACTVVIFGATGDLTHRKLVPALYNLAVDGELPPGVKILGFARRDWTDDFFREGLEKLNREVFPHGT
ncbi:hypothetical protein N9925_00240 [bacterium]|nr:hypothetical protein [bacterium]